MTSYTIENPKKNEADKVEIFISDYKPAKVSVFWGSAKVCMLRRSSAAAGLRDARRKGWAVTKGEATP